MNEHIPTTTGDQFFGNEGGETGRPADDAIAVAAQTTGALLVGAEMLGPRPRRGGMTVNVSPAGVTEAMTPPGQQSGGQIVRSGVGGT